MKAYRISTYSLTQSYDVESLFKRLVELGYEPKSYDHVIHIKAKRADQTKMGDVFYFPYGCVSCWGFSKEEEHALIKIANEFANTPFGKSVEDVFKFSFSDSEQTHIIEEDDHLIISSNDESELVMLSFSHALSQSVKLIEFEESVTKKIRDTHWLTQELANTGSIPLSRQKLAKQIGELFVERHSINMYGDMLDTPEFLWRRPKFEPLYLMAVEFLDIRTRVQILNRRSEVVYELYRVLSDELQHSHSSRLEWVVIILIAVEVVFTVLREGHLLIGWLH